MKKRFRWTDGKVIDFIEWYLKFNNLSLHYTLENKDILKSFKNGDSPELWRRKENERLFQLGIKNNPLIKLERDEIKELCKAGYKLKAVKRLKELTGWGLRQAKEYVDNIDYYQKD